MASTTRTVTVPFPPDDALRLAVQAAEPIRDFKRQRVYEKKRVALYARGFGFTNPIDIKIAVHDAGGESSHVEYTASTMALFDPFGFNTTTLDRFCHQLEAHADHRNGGPVPPEPLRDRKGMTVTLVSVAVLAVVLVPVVFCVLFDALS